MRTVAIAILALAVLSAPGAAAAPAPQPFVVSAEPSASCPEIQGFASRLLRQSPHVRPANGAEACTRYWVATRATAEGYSGRLQIQEPDGRVTEREVSGESCSGVLDALVLIAAILAEQRAALVASSPPPPPPPPLSADSDSRRWSFGVGTALGINSAAGPGAPLDFGIDLLVFPHLVGGWAPELRLGGLERGNERVTRPSGRAVFEGWAVRVGASPFRWPSQGSLSLRPVAGVELGRLAARGEDTVDPGEPTVPWWALGLTLAGELQVLRVLGVTGEAGLVVPLRHGVYASE